MLSANYSYTSCTDQPIYRSILLAALPLSKRGCVDYVGVNITPLSLYRQLLREQSEPVISPENKCQRWVVGRVAT